MSSKNAAAADASLGTSKSAPIELSGDDDDDDESASSTSSPTLLSPPTKNDGIMWSLKLSLPQQPQEETGNGESDVGVVVVVISISPNATVEYLEALVIEKLFEAATAAMPQQSTDIVLKHGYPPKNLVTNDNKLDKLSSVLENHARILVTVSSSFNHGSKNTAAGAGAGEKRAAAATIINGGRENNNNAGDVNSTSSSNAAASSSKRQRLVQEISGMKIKAMKQELSRYGASYATMLEKDEIVQALVDARLNNQHCAAVSSTTTAAATTTYSNNKINKNYTIESPIKLLKTNLDRTTNSASPLVQEHCLSMRQLLGLDASTTTGNNYQMPFGCRIDWLVISNFMIQFDYLVQEVLPELISVPTSVIFYESDCSSPGSSTRRQLEQSPNIDVVEISPKAEPRRKTSNNNNNNNSPNPCQYKFPFGTHHTKMFLVGRSNGTLRVIIHTCNIIQGDAAVKAQGAYCQDFPLKTAAAATAAATAASSSSSSPFEDDLIDYMSTYGYERQQPWGPSGQGTTGSPPRTTLCQELKRFDFSGAKGVLIASTPGYYALDSDEANNRGYLKLSKAIREHCPPSAAASSLPWSSSPFPPIVCQFSSVGALSEKYLLEFCSKLNADKEPCKNLAKSLKLVFPTPDDIRNSVEGYSGGGTVPSSKNNVYKPFLKPLWHRWTSPLSASSPTIWPLLKPNNVPHIKTYYQLTGKGGGDSDESSMQWFCLTSHNLSKAAWGEIRKNDRGQHLYVPSWELGVFVAPSMFETKEEKAAGNKVKMVSISATAAAAATGSNTSATNSTATTRIVGIPLPYAINPTNYETMERPFSWEETYPLPDRFGRRGVRG